MPDQTDHTVKPRMIGGKPYFNMSSAAKYIGYSAAGLYKLLDRLDEKQEVENKKAKEEGREPEQIALTRYEFSVVRGKFLLKDDLDKLFELKPEELA